MKCGECGTENIIGSNFCEKCGERLVPSEVKKSNTNKVVCAKCEAMISSDSNFCSKCGTVLGINNRLIIEKEEQPEEHKDYEKAEDLLFIPPKRKEHVRPSLLIALIIIGACYVLVVASFLVEIQGVSP